MSDRREIEWKPLTDWLADTAMLVVHEARNEAALPSGDLREAVEVCKGLATDLNAYYEGVPVHGLDGLIEDLSPLEAGKRADALRVVLAHVTGWVEINGPEDLPKERGEYLFRKRENGSPLSWGKHEVRAFDPLLETPAKERFTACYSHWQAINGPKEGTEG